MLAARQMGYLGAVPEGWKESRGAELLREGFALPMPDISGLQWLWIAWQEAGCASPEGGPIAWAEALAFASIAGLTRAEAKIVRAMSSAFCEGREIGKKPLGMAPYDPE